MNFEGAPKPNNNEEIVEGEIIESRESDDRSTIIDLDTIRSLGGMEGLSDEEVREKFTSMSLDDIRKLVEEQGYFGNDN